MFDDLPSDLARLHTLRVWHALWLHRIDSKIAVLQKREAQQERAQRDRPKGPDWFAELGADTGQPVAVHTGDCYLTGKPRRPIDRADALRLLDSGLPACRACRPDNDLAFLG